MDECRSFGLMQQHKVVLVENADVLLKGGDGGGDEDEDDAKPAVKGKGKRTGGVSASPRGILEKYCESPSDSATLVLRASTWRPGNLDKAAAKVGAVVKCEPPTEAEAAAWARKRCAKRHGCDIEPMAAQMLVQAVGADLGRIDTELEKLALAAGAHGETITADLVREMVGVTREDQFFAIQETLLSGDAAGGLRHLRHLLDVCRHDPVPLMWAYVEAARKLHVAASAKASGQSPRAVMGHLKAWGPMLDRVLAAGGRVPATRSAALLNSAVRADQAIKSGGGDPERILERLTLNFAQTLA